MAKTIRHGAIGALLDEYERALKDLKKLIKTIADGDLAVITDPKTKDQNCRSIQTILTHVVHSGYGYAVNVHNLKGDTIVRPPKKPHQTTKEYLNDLADVFSFTEEVFKNVKESEIERFDNASKIKTSWGQWYDIEQMMEHSIVHILRHRRQIERMNTDVLKQ